MFGLIRRISHGVIPRPDRPWEEDPTSNAPQRNRKRRLSSPEREEVDEEQSGKKKVRAESSTPSMADTDATFLTPAPQTETSEVKEVTQGVEEVDLDDKEGKETDHSPETAAPESVPLPDEQSGELDEATSDADEASSSGSRGDDDAAGDGAVPVAHLSIPQASTSKDAAEAPVSDEPSHDNDKVSGSVDPIPERPTSVPKGATDET